MVGPLRFCHSSSIFSRDSVFFDVITGPRTFFSTTSYLTLLIKMFYDRWPTFLRNWTRSKRSNYSSDSALILAITTPGFIGLDAALFLSPTAEVAAVEATVNVSALSC